jgi:hypothetical protein
MTKHEEALKLQEELKDKLKEFLYINRGKKSTSVSDEIIIAMADTFITLGYNEAFHKLKGQ